MSGLMQQAMTPLTNLDKCILTEINEQMTHYIYRGVLRTEGTDKLQRLLFVYISSNGLVRFASFNFMENSNDSGLYPTRATCNICAPGHTEAFIRIAQTITKVFPDTVDRVGDNKSNSSYINGDMLKLYINHYKNGILTKEPFYKTVPVTSDALYIEQNGNVMYHIEKIARILEYTSRLEFANINRVNQLEADNKELTEQLTNLKSGLSQIVHNMSKSLNSDLK